MAVTRAKKRDSDIVFDAEGCPPKDKNFITFAENCVGERAPIRMRKRELAGYRPAKPEDLAPGYEGYVGADGNVYKGGDLIVMIGSRERAEHEENDRLRKLASMGRDKERAMDEEAGVNVMDPEENYQQVGKRGKKTYFYGKK